MAALPRHKRIERKLDFLSPPITAGGRVNLCIERLPFESGRFE
jgi:hypothetical protein